MPHPEDDHKFTKQALSCLRAMGDYAFHNPLHSVPWGGRPYVLGRRHILQKYLNDEDILQAFWIHEKELRSNPDWRWKEPGLSHLAKLMSERSGNRWRQEQQAFQETTPTLMGYMEAEWGEETRLALAQHRASEASRRRAAFQVVASS